MKQLLKGSLIKFMNGEYTSSSFEIGHVLECEIAEDYNLPVMVNSANNNWCEMIKYNKNTKIKFIYFSHNVQQVGNSNPFIFKILISSSSNIYHICIVKCFNNVFFKMFHPAMIIKFLLSL